MPNVFKWDYVLNHVAGDSKAYVVDFRALGWDYEHAWKIVRDITSHLRYLGIQNTPRKRRVENGPWAGTICNSTTTSISRSVTSKMNEGYELSFGPEGKAERLIR